MTSSVVCAIRGGLDSQSTIAKAVDLAREKDLTIHFLYVISQEWLPDSDQGRSEDLSGHLRQMADAVLARAQALANSHGVDAQSSVRHGDVEQEIAKVCRGEQASYLVLNAPQAKEGNVFTPKRLAEFAKELERDTGARVVWP